MGKQERRVHLLYSLVDYETFFFGLGAVWKSMDNSSLQFSSENSQVAVHKFGLTQNFALPAF